MIFLVPTFRANTFVFRIHITYMMAVNQYHSNVSTLDPIKRLSLAGTCPWKSPFFFLEPRDTLAPLSY